ncbi:MAG TPA: SMC-Scp complex subunit ScpB [Hyphomonadaceae bacterium]|nr:SMC-Scp complex subunit ScpB [Hyphomonadaceae bacterium]
MSAGKKNKKGGKPEAASVDEIREAVAKLSKQKQAEAKAQPAAEPAPAKTAKAEVDPERLADALRRAEAVLFASDEPVDAKTLTEALPQGIEAGDVLGKLKAAYANKGVQLVELAGKWRFQTAPDLAFLFEETREQPKPLSRAALETLAIIAYCQPVTRPEIEDIRGVAVSPGTIDILMEAGWVRPRGRRRTPGRPVTFGTTDAFLVHFGLDAVDSLPGRDDLKAAGLLSAEIPRDFEFAGTPRDPETGELLGEDPLEDAEFQSDFLEGAEDRA